MSYRITFCWGRSGRLQPGDVPDPDAFQNGRFGFWYFHWLPRAHYNRGRPWRREVLDLTAHWLCFWIGVTAWPPHHQGGENA